MLATANGAMLITEGNIGSTSGLWFYEASGFLTQGLVYNTSNTIWLNLDLSLIQGVTWTIVS